VPEPCPPPPTLAENDDGAFRGPFLFWFQRGLAVVTALQRLQNHARLVSEPDLSLTDRPRPSEGRFKKSVYFQCLVVIGRASFSKVQPIAQFVAKPEDGRRAVDVGGKQPLSEVYGCRGSGRSLEGTLLPSKLLLALAKAQPRSERSSVRPRNEIGALRAVQCIIADPLGVTRPECSGS
jgi:hypothetical protein